MAKIYPDDRKPEKHSHLAEHLISNRFETIRKHSLPNLINEV